ncbi:hypothetical protein Moror_13103 [Moniliophthora roreri MCA 2997]|uniref:Zn(2)-C6 fungal-type domain-containing protein n=1 Tax=Moniliophthora roreri (strain MCA 2997) TaxID=1381753 RepID=V2X5E2_MONRO|nr:hypothetical protein Moror_13103 [Moniliophthora roreri MCA 2997]KAI3618178.1 hypothetical protein WG66_005838 [Moniliophthora roreri]
MSQWNHNLGPDYEDAQFNPSQSSYNRVPFQQSFSNEYPTHSPNQNQLYASGIQPNSVNGSPYSTQQPQLHSVDTHLNSYGLTHSSNAGPSTSFSSSNGSSFINSLSMQQQPTSYQPPTYNFNNTYDQSPTANGVFNMSTNPSLQGHTPQNGPSGSQRRSYYPRSTSDTSTGSAVPSKAKRVRSYEQTDEGADDDADNGGKPDHGQKGKPHACARCKSLKVRCEFKTDTDPCKRCLNGGHECVIPGRKKRRTPPKREHLLAEIQKQAETIERLMAQLAAAEEAQKHQLRSSASDSLSGTSSPPILSPSSADANSSYFGDHPPPNAEANKVVEDWIVKARESLAEFGGFIGIGGASMPKRYIVDEDPEDESSGDDEDLVVVDDTDNDYEIAVIDEDGDEWSPHDVSRRPSSHRGSASSTGSRPPAVAGPLHVRDPKKKDSGEKLATLPSEAAPFGLMATLSLKNTKRGSSVELEEPNGDDNGEGLGVANADFFRASPAPDPKRTQVDNAPHAPLILTRGVITPSEAEALFKIFFDTMNLSVSLVDPILYTAQRTVHRSPFLFTVICAIGSRFYSARPELYQQAMHYAQLAAGNALIGGQKNVEMCMAFILLSLYPVPFKRWEDSRSYLYLGLAIRIAIELNLHLPPTAKPQNESHAREQLNRTRVWINCFNLDRSTSSQYGKRPIISNIDYIANHSENWWSSSEYNLKNFDIQLCCYNAELKIMAKFIEKIYSDPSHPTGLNKDLNFEQVAIETDEELQQLEAKWRPILDKNVDQNDSHGAFRVGLLKLAYSYSRLIALSYGFQHAFGKGSNQNEKPFLKRCLDAATEVVKVVVEYNNRPDFRIYVRHGPEAQSVFVTFAAAFLVKLLQPKFASLLDDEVRTGIRARVQSVIDYLGSPEIAIDDRHGPKLYARFLKNLMASPLVRRKSTRPKSVTTSPSDASSASYQSWTNGTNGSVDHPSPATTTHSLSPPPSHDAMSFDQFAPSSAGGLGSVDPFAPSLNLGTGTTMGGSSHAQDYSGMAFFGSTGLSDDDMMNMNMQSFPDPSGWQNPGMF